MAKAKALTYEELIEYAMAHYNRGGDVTVECCDKKWFDDYVAQFGPITKRVALQMFRDDYEYERDRSGYWR